MKIDVNNIFTVVSLVFLLIGGIYRLAQIEASINSKISKIESNLLTEIDALKDRLIERFYSAEKKFDVHLQDYVNYKDSVLLAIHGCEEQIDHKWHRTEEELAKDRAEIRDLRGFLVRKLDFKIRDDRC